MRFDKFAKRFASCENSRCRLEAVTHISLPQQLAMAASYYLGHDRDEMAPKRYDQPAADDDT